MIVDHQHRPLDCVGDFSLITSGVGRLRFTGVKKIKKFQKKEKKIENLLTKKKESVIVSLTSEMTTTLPVHWISRNICSQRFL